MITMITIMTINAPPHMHDDVTYLCVYDDVTYVYDDVITIMTMNEPPRPS